MRAWMAGLVLLGCAAFARAADLPPAPWGVVADSAGLFSADERAKIEAFGADVLQKQSVSLRVLTLSSAGGEDPKAIAVRALNSWHVGPNSVLLLLVMSPRALYLQPGTALAPTFPAQASSWICSAVVAPHMRAREYASATLEGFGAIRDRLVSPRVTRVASAAPVNPAPPAPAADLSAPVFALLLLAFPAYWLFAKLLARKCPRCQARMGRTTEVIQRPSDTAAGVRQILYLCDACNYKETETKTIAASALYADSSGWSSGSDGGGSSSSGSDSSSSDGSGGGGSSW